VPKVFLACHHDITGNNGCPDHSGRASMPRGSRTVYQLVKSIGTVDGRTDLYSDVCHPSKVHHGRDRGSTTPRPRRRLPAQKKDKGTGKGPLPDGGNVFLRTRRSGATLTPPRKVPDPPTASVSPPWEASPPVVPRSLQCPSTVRHRCGVPLSEKRNAERSVQSPDAMRGGSSPLVLLTALALSSEPCRPRRAHPTGRDIPSLGSSVDAASPSRSVPCTRRWSSAK
jgi:hypothetical protein